LKSKRNAEKIDKTVNVNKGFLNKRFSSLIKVVNKPIKIIIEEENQIAKSMFEFIKTGFISIGV